MATRFYLPSSGVPAPVAVTPSASWTVNTGFTSQATDTVKGATATAAGTARTKGSATNPSTRLDSQFVSARRLSAQTIAIGTFSAVIRGVESVSTADAWLDMIIRVVSADGTAVRGTLYAGSANTVVSATSTAENFELPTTSATATKSAIATTQVIAQGGDRICIEIGYKASTVTTTNTCTFRYGDTAATADFALTVGLTTDLCPWVELSATLVWDAAPPPPNPWVRRKPLLVR